MLWQASSITTRSNRRVPSSRSSRPVVVSHRRRRPYPRMRSTAWASSRRASASSDSGFARASRASPPGSGLARVVRAGLAEQGQGLLDQLAGQRARRRGRSTSRSSVCSRSSGITRAGCPSRTARSPCGQQALEQIVDRHVARCAGQHLVAAAHGPADQLDHGGRLAGAGRTVNEGHVAGRQGELHGVELRLVERAVERPHRRDRRRTPAAARPSSTSRRIRAAIAASTRACSSAARCRCVATSSNDRSSRQARSRPSRRAGRPGPRRSTVRSARR